MIKEERPEGLDPFTWAIVKAVGAFDLFGRAQLQYVRVDEDVTASPSRRKKALRKHATAASELAFAIRDVIEEARRDEDS